MCRGFDHEPVSARQLPKSVGCSKNFTGKNCLDTREKVGHLMSSINSVNQTIVNKAFPFLEGYVIENASQILGFLAVS